MLPSTSLSPPAHLLPPLGSVTRAREAPALFLSCSLSASPCGHTVPPRESSPPPPRRCPTHSRPSKGKLPGGPCPVGQRLMGSPVTSPRSLCPADRPPATGRSPEATFLFSVELRVSVTQIWQDLPHLKAVVMYGEPPVGKVANVYTVRERPGRLAVGGGASGPPADPAPLSPTADGGAHGAGGPGARGGPGRRPQHPAAQPVLRAGLHVRHHGQPQGRDAESGQRRPRPGGGGGWAQEVWADSVCGPP